MACLFVYFECIFLFPENRHDLASGLLLYYILKKKKLIESFIHVIYIKSKNRECFMNKIKPVIIQSGV